MITGKPRAETRRTLAHGLTLLAGSWIFVVIRLFRNGRPSRILSYDDVVYFLDGQTFAGRIRSDGLISSLWEWLGSSPHAPLLELLSTLSHLSGLRQPQTTYLFHSVLVMGLVTYFTISSIPRNKYRFHIAALVIASPLVSVFANEFRPDSLWIVTALGTLTHAGMMTSNSNNQINRVLKFHTLAFGLLFLKPSWLVFTVLLISVAMCMRWIIGYQCHGKSALIRAVAIDSMALSATLMLWTAFVRDEFFVYVLRNVNTEEFLSTSWSKAILDSLMNSLSYLGYPVAPLRRMLVLVLMFAVLAFPRYTSLPKVEKRSSLCRNLFKQKSSMVFKDSRISWPAVALGALAVGAGMAFATGISRHPSAFQGLAILAMVALGGVALLCLLGQRQENHPNNRVGISTALLLLLVGLLQWNLTFGGGHTSLELSKPRPTSELLVSVIQEECARRDICVTPAKIAVPFAEELSWQSILYAAAERNLDLQLIHLDWFSSDVNLVLPDIKTASFVVVSTRNYLGNRVPINALQEQIYQSFRSDKRFTNLTTIDHYVLYVRNDTNGVLTEENLG